MAKLQYVGTSDVRGISRADWREVGIDHDAIEIVRKNEAGEVSYADDLATVVVSEEAAELLLEREPSEWKRVEDSARARAKKGGESRSAEEEAAEPRRSRRRAVESVAPQAEAAKE